jgi:ATP-dependent protease ClpP protease subunit
MGHRSVRGRAGRRLSTFRKYTPSFLSGEGEQQPELPVHGHVQVQSAEPHGGDESGVTVDENKVYFYSSVTSSSVLELNQVLRSLDTEMQCLSVRFNMPETFPIELHIHSEGGDLFAGFAAADTIGSLRTPVHTYVEGAAASAATLMSVCGRKRFITKSSLMLIHQLSALMVEGTHEQFRDEFTNQELLMQKIKDIYRGHTKLDEETLDGLLKHDLWLSAERCLELGLVDAVL